MTDADVEDLSQFFAESGVDSETNHRRAEQEAGSFGLFIRSLVGLDKHAVVEALGRFASSAGYTANQLEFLNLVIDELTEKGTISPARFYESPFTDVSPQGPEGVFTEHDLADLLDVLAQVRRNAGAA
jgi:type I restriction enzyme R subunit